VIPPISTKRIIGYQSPQTIEHKKDHYIWCWKSSRDTKCTCSNLFWWAQKTFQKILMSPAIVKF